MHEDLNRILKKPYFHGVETENRCLEDIAEEVPLFFYSLMLICAVMDSAHPKRKFYYRGFISWIDEIEC